MVAEWVALRSILEVCAKETGYEGGMRLRTQWWQHTAAERQQRTTLKDILTEVWERRQQESVRSGEDEG